MTAGNSTELPKSGLLLIGMGPGQIGSMTIEARNAAKSADFRRYEAYTALWPADELTKLEEDIGDIEMVMRPEVESPTELLDLAKNHLVALLIVGDPLQATTHVDIQLQALEAGINCMVFHGISITTLVTGAVGLSNYRFGRQTTITYPYGGWVATSPLEVIAVNLFQNQHTLALLDLDPTGAGTGKQVPMQPKDAYDSLGLMKEKLSSTISDMSEESTFDSMKKLAFKEFVANGLDSIKVVLCADMGTKEEKITYTTVGDLKNTDGGRLNSLIFPAITSEVEEKALLRWQ
ncbi:MAG: diphthine synthase [Euryarchaeota archaeon TMED132]|nr:diphthine synthase [Euryarchaeota archaeon]RAH06142.1 MAG: diphthine synthase [Euryarchaeota archaeon TMED132]|tara:strand:+ start:4284 stop:5156 length:873 start_codon:yes stop_codon:yes gene_type:complete